MIKEIIIDGNNFNSLEQFYNEVENKLTSNLDWRIGRNLDAFDDVLLGGFGMHEYEEPIILTWINSNKSKQDLGLLETIKYLEDLVQNCHPDNKKDLNQELENYKSLPSYTMYDLIVDIIKSHEQIEFREK